MLDDQDVFESPLSGRFWWAHLPSFAVQGNHATRNLHEVLHAFHGRSGLRKTEIPLFRHQERALFDLETPGLVLEGDLIVGRAGKGEPKQRETPLLSNTPSTTPKTAKQSLDRQLSPGIKVMSGLDDADEWEPPFRANNLDRRQLQHNPLLYHLRANGYVRR